MSTTRRFARAAAATVAALTAATALAACGGGDDSAAQPGANASFNLVDVGFAQQMIPHHSQAVKMAALAATRAKDPKVKKLAAQIVSAQGPEIETMQGFLESWGEPLVPNMADMEHSSMSPEDMSAMTSGSMPGMATDNDLARLSTAKGAAFDRLFLQLMLEHHRAALEMAQKEQTEGRSEPVTALAEEIVTTQNAEITRMRKLQDA